MKTLIPAAMLAIALALPVGAIAGELPAPPLMMLGEDAQALHLTAQQQQQINSVWSAAHAKLRQLHIDGRAQILGSLSQQQRSLLAQVVGNLAISPNPSEEAAAQQIQSSLTPQQSQRIVALHTALMQQAMNILHAAKTQADSYLTPDQRSKVQQEMSVHGAHEHMGPGGMGMDRVNSNTAAGEILLGMALHGGHMNMEYKVKVIEHQ